MLTLQSIVALLHSVRSTGTHPTQKISEKQEILSKQKKFQYTKEYYGTLYVGIRGR